MHEDDERPGLFQLALLSSGATFALTLACVSASQDKWADFWIGLVISLLGIIAAVGMNLTMHDWIKSVTAPEAEPEPEKKHTPPTQYRENTQSGFIIDPMVDTGKMGVSLSDFAASITRPLGSNGGFIGAPYTPGDTPKFGTETLFKRYERLVKHPVPVAQVTAGNIADLAAYLYGSVDFSGAEPVLVVEGKRIPIYSWVDTSGNHVEGQDWVPFGTYTRVEDKK